MSWKKKRLRKAGTVQELKVKLWQAVIEAERIVIEGETDPQKIQAIHALSGLAKTYVKVEEILDIEERLSHLEEQLNLSANGTTKQTPYYN